MHTLYLSRSSNANECRLTDEIKAQRLGQAAGKLSRRMRTVEIKFEDVSVEDS